MKKQIALLATLIAASGFTAFGQDWMEITGFGNSTGVYDMTGANGGTVVGQGAYGSGSYDVVWLWASSSAADLLSAVGTAGNMAGNLSTPKQQVATNGVASVTWAQSIGSLSNMLNVSTWSVISDENSGSGTATLGQAVVTTGTKSKITAFNGGDAFQISGVSASSGSTIEMLAVAVNASAIVGGSLDIADITQIGWSNPFDEAVGSSAGDPNDNGTEDGTGGMNAFGVSAIASAVPEPTTLALAGLGGLSMLFLRRRKA